MGCRAFAQLLLGIAAQRVSLAAKLQWHEPLERGVKALLRCGGSRLSSARRSACTRALVCQVPPQELTTMGVQAEKLALARPPARAMPTGA